MFECSKTPILECDAMLIIPDRQSVKVSKLDLGHTCARIVTHSLLSFKLHSRVDWLLQVVPTVLKVGAKTYE
jgi:hypothetical protein